MPLKYESMPKITFCFTKDDLQEIRKIMFALQVLPVFWDTGLYFMPMCFFSNISAQDTVKQIKKKSPRMMTRDITTKNYYIYKLGFVICKYFLPLLLFCLKQ